MDNNFFDSNIFENLYKYDGQLGVIYSKEKSKFILWAPTANEVKLALYGKDGYDYTCKEKELITMKKSEYGTWLTEIKGDLNGEYYNYIVNVSGSTNILVDPYAKAVGVNGDRGMVVDLQATNPREWDKDKRVKLNDATDAIIYEIHIRDLTIDKSSGIEEKHRGKYYGFTVGDSTIPGTNIKTVINHIREMGFTHVQIMPTFDYGSVDESKLNKPQFNWGYDPKNYNVPEGYYSSNAYFGETRIKEFKEMIQSIHNNGLGVVMDVVYNHTFNLNSNLNLAVPGYYYRQNDRGEYTNGSGCGNETASERVMFRKYMVDSILYWAKEYHIDGFRFDLMGLHDIETMIIIRKELDKIDSSILMYGEGWCGGFTPLKYELSANKYNIKKFKDLQIAAFSDECRDCIKGAVFNKYDGGFVSGAKGLEENIKFLVVASTYHKEIDLNTSINLNQFWANEPYQTINYMSCHDNYTIWDKLVLANVKADENELIRMNKLAAAILLTSQGIVFMQSGEEFARRKVDELGRIIENSYCSSDFINKIDWNRKEKYKELVEYYRGLISLRKKYKVFRMSTSKDIRESISFLQKGENYIENNIVAYSINYNSMNQNLSKFIVIFNSNNFEVNIKLPEKEWDVLVDENISGVNVIKKIKGNKVVVARKSALILMK